MRERYALVTHGDQHLRCAIKAGADQTTRFNPKAKLASWMLSSMDEHGNKDGYDQTQKTQKNSIPIRESMSVGQKTI
ncbi:hypothetical protein TZ00_17960 [Agreia bicolorata]|uniref:Uncharacterized protein n=1 Tax=Agreia bicolorata TaxID=110935 RepID=A0ABR5CB88_9MICO|nr:hypothetical protein TZ00_17960 [Agreia bicolorata]